LIEAISASASKAYGDPDPELEKKNQDKKIMQES
jgi:hypothetical protein